MNDTTEVGNNLRIAQHPHVQPRDVECPKNEGDEVHDMTRSIDIDIIESKSTLVVTCKCSCGWIDELEINGDGIHNYTPK